MREVILVAILVFAGCVAPAENDPPPNEDSTEEGPELDGESPQAPPKPTPNPAPRPKPEQNETQETPIGPPVEEQNNKGNQSWIPNVIVGTFDNGINPYHQLFYRPNRTEHPCTYLQGIPCSVQALNLSVGGDDLQAMMDADKEILDSVQQETFYWIPKTPFVAVVCHNEISGAACFLPTSEDEGRDHATGTISSILSEAPNASIAFSTTETSPTFFNRNGVNVDILSISTLPLVPLPVPDGRFVSTPTRDFLSVQGAGNWPNPTLIYGQSVMPDVVLVGGAYDTPAEEALASKLVDVVSYFCRPGAYGWSATEMVAVCGTSFSAPTVAGALAQTLLEVRMETGYTGNTERGIMEPSTGLTIQGLRDVMNHTATYAPQQRFPAPGGVTEIPLNSEAPWLQFGWGFVDGQLSSQMTRYVLGEELPERPDGAVAYMGAFQSFRDVYYGEN